MNNVDLIGRLTKDPDIRQTAEGKAFASYTLAVDRGFGQNKTTDFIPCVSFGRSAEYARDYLYKGLKIAVSSGSIKTGSYTNKEGKKVYTWAVVVGKMQFLDHKRKEDVQEDAPEEKDESFMDIPEDVQEELPFL